MLMYSKNRIKGQCIHVSSDDNPFLSIECPIMLMLSINLVLIEVSCILQSTVATPPLILRKPETQSVLICGSYRKYNKGEGNTAKVTRDLYFFPFPFEQACFLTSPAQIDASLPIAEMYVTHIKVDLFRMHYEFIPIFRSIRRAHLFLFKHCSLRIELPKIPEQMKKIE